MNSFFTLILGMLEPDQNNRLEMGQVLSTLVDAERNFKS
jgi:hypothetical protein